MTADCPITGDAVVTRTVIPGGPDRLEWTHADPETHISDDVLAVLDDHGRAFLDERYEVGELCPDPNRRGCRHARLRTGERPA